MTQKIDLPVPVLGLPHWRVIFRPAEYNEILVPTLGKCFEIVEKNKVSLRGWDYPHLSTYSTERGQGNNWVASWSSFMSHYEYWRFYQSGQFIHFFGVREATKAEWRQQLQSEIKSHLSHVRDIDWGKVPGYISIINFIYSTTEIYEFAARLCQAQIYSGTIKIIIELKDIKGYVLTAPWERAWHNYYAASENVLKYSNTYQSDKLVATSKEAALKTVIWFFERFGWINPSESMISQDQDKLIKGRY
jgi:hypothetical protein